MRYLLVHLVRRDLLVKYHISTAAYNFSKCLIDSDIFDQTISILPINVLKYDDELEADGMSIISSNLRKGNRLLTFVSCVWEQIKAFSKIKRGSSVWLYNITVLNAFFYVLLRIFKPCVKIYTIVLDFTPEDKSNKYFLPLINKSDGIIKLADSDMFTNNNSVCLPGVVEQGGQHTKMQAPFTANFLVGGNIKEQIVMISMLLKAFSKMPDFHLHISGQAINPEPIEKAARKYSNIHYYGLAPYDEYLKILNKCPFLLSTRDPKEPRNLCNFPSKIMEGLKYNKIIISTIHYNQLDGINYFEVPASEDDFINAIKEIAAKSDEELLLYANQAEKTAKLFNTNRWKSAIEKIEGFKR